MISKVGGYVRISRKDGDKIESDSIENQRTIISDYIKKNSDDLSLVKYYADDDYTGTNFDRPAFKQMLSDIEKKKIDCIIVKDLSRFGRDYIDVGKYLQKEFPYKGVRFIAITDNIDSAKQAYDMLMPVKNIFNEQYARDISKKVISAMRSKQENGIFVGAFTSYGYKKDPDNKGKLIIDQYAATIVRRIFDMYNEGKPQLTIAKILNDEGIVSPYEYKKAMNQKYTNSKKLDATSYWTYATIRRVLQNEIYTGAMVQHKFDGSHYKMKKSNFVDKNEWCIVPNTHEAIIDESTWKRTQELLGQNTRVIDFTQNISLYAGFLVCSDCGRSMTKRVTRKRVRYVCGTYARYSSKYCASHRIFEDDLEKIVTSQLNKYILKIQEAIDYLLKEIENKKEQNSKKIDVSQELNKLHAQLLKVQKMKQGLYEDLKNSILSLEEYQTFKNDYAAQEEGLNKKIKALEDLSNTTAESILQNYWIRTFQEAKEINTLTRPILSTFIKRIIVGEKNKIEIIYRFNTEILEKYSQL